MVYLGEIKAFLHNLFFILSGKDRNKATLPTSRNWTRWGCLTIQCLPLQSFNGQSHDLMLYLTSLEGHNDKLPINKFDIEKHGSVSHFSFPSSSYSSLVFCEQQSSATHLGNWKLEPRRSKFKMFGATAV